LTRPPLATQGASSPVLPFDLHVLGLPPAFTLSQDQTLHLKLLDRSPNFRVQSPSSPNYSLHLHALNRLGSVRTSARWTTIHLPDARTSHLRTLSKIRGEASAPSPRTPSFPPG